MSGYQKSRDMLTGLMLPTDSQAAGLSAPTREAMVAVHNQLIACSNLSRRVVDKLLVTFQSRLHEMGALGSTILVAPEGSTSAMLPDASFARMFRLLLEETRAAIGSDEVPPVVANVHPDVSRVILNGVMVDSVNVTDSEHPYDRFPVGAIEVLITIDDLEKGTFRPTVEVATRMAEVQCSFADAYKYVHMLAFCFLMQPLLARITDAINRIERRVQARRVAHANKRARHCITFSQRIGKVPWAGDPSAGDLRDPHRVAEAVQPTRGAQGVPPPAIG